MRRESDGEVRPRLSARASLPRNRPTRPRRLPPPCDQMKLMLLYFVALLGVPEATSPATIGSPVAGSVPSLMRFQMARLVSVLYSTTWGPVLGNRLWQHGASTGCEYTTALRRLSSANTGSNPSSPSH